MKQYTPQELASGQDVADIKAQNEALLGWCDDCMRVMNALVGDRNDGMLSSAVYGILSDKLKVIREMT